MRTRTPLDGWVQPLNAAADANLFTCVHCFTHLQQRHSANALGWLSSEEQTRDGMVGLGVVEALVELLEVGTDNGKRYE